MITKSLHYVFLEVRNLPYYDGLIDVYMVSDEFEREVPEDHHFQALELELHALPARWWCMHKESFAGWSGDR